MEYSYALQNYDNEHMARAVGRALPVSRKASIEIGNTIRHKTVARAKTILKEVISMKAPIKFTRFTNGAGHKPGMASGKYPQKAAEHILALVEAVESNAQFKGLNTSNLIITHFAVQFGGNAWKYGRQKRRKAKRTNIEIAVAEGKAKEKKTADKKEEKSKPKEDKK
jgi:large subunit ribosomal protein L22